LINEIYIYTYQTRVLIHQYKSLKIPKGQSESVYRRTDNTMAKKSTKGQTMIYKKTHIKLKIE